MSNVIPLRPDAVMAEPPKLHGGNAHEAWIELGDLIKVRAAGQRFWATVTGVTGAGHLSVQVGNETGIPGLHFGQLITVRLEEQGRLAVWVPA